MTEALKIHLGNREKIYKRQSCKHQLLKIRMEAGLVIINEKHRDLPSV